MQIRKTGLLLATLGMAGLSACRSLQDYPDEWPSLRQLQASECPLLDGVFDSRAVSFSGHLIVGKDPRLSGILAWGLVDRIPSPAAERLERMDRIGVHLRGSRLELEAYGKDGDSLTGHLPVELPCEKSLVIVSRGRGRGFEEWGGLGLAADGSLVYVTERHSGLAPALASQRGWARFKSASQGE